MKEEIIFQFDNVLEKEDFISILPKDVINVQKNKHINKQFFSRENTKLNADLDVNTILTLLISGGTISTIIISIKELILKYWDLKKASEEKNNGRLLIQKGSSKIEIDLNNFDRDWREIIGNELIESLFVSKDEE